LTPEQLAERKALMHLYSTEPARYEVVKEATPPYSPLNYKEEPEQEAGGGVEQEAGEAEAGEAEAAEEEEEEEEAEAEAEEEEADFPLESGSFSSKKAQQKGLRDMFTQPNASVFKVRGLSYMADRVKVPSEQAAGTLLSPCLVALPSFDRKYDHLLRLPSIYNYYRRKADAVAEKSFIFAVNLQVPGTPEVSLLTTWSIPPPAPQTSPSMRKFYSLLQRFVRGPASFRNQRFKLIPRLVEGPWVVRSAVGAKPALLGTKLAQRYFVGPKQDYIEVDVDIGSSVVADQITRLCRGYAKSLVVDIGIVLQGECEEELPEVVLGVFRAQFVDMQSAQSPIDLDQMP
jgi:hypothetical protein